MRGIGADVHGRTTWSPGTTTRRPTTPENEKFVAAYKAKYGANRVTDDPIEAGYFGVYLWTLAVEKAGSTEVDKVKRGRRAASSSTRPRAWSRSTATNQHISKTVRIGKIRADGLIDEIWSTGKPVEPDPYLETYDWAESLTSQKP